MNRRRRKLRLATGKGYTLLEVILSIAILGGSMVVIGRGFYIGYRSVRSARMIDQANRIADSTMAEVAAGIIDPRDVGATPVIDAPGWTYSVEVDEASEPGLLTATVRVQNDTTIQAVSVSIVRFVIDPDYDPLEARSAQ